LDEATAIKSFRSKRSKAVKKLSNAPFKYALTGTPIENGKPEELFSIMQFVNDKVLGRFDIFDKTFIMRNHWGGVLRYKNLPTFHETMQGHFVRKSQTDPDVAPHMPDTIHLEPIEVVLDRSTAKLYNKIIEDLTEELEIAMNLFGSSFNIFSHYGHEGRGSNDADEYRGRIMAKVTCLRMLCQHPDLVRISAKKYLALSGEGSQYAASLLEDGWLDEITKTPKFDVTIRYIKDFLEQDEANKVVIFSSFVDMVDRLRNALDEYGAKIYTGKLDAKTKEANKIALNTDPACRVLVSSDAGGYGVDLPAANLLVNYDLPWTSGGAVQRNGRIKRASSKWPSIVIQDVLVARSIEVRQHEMLSQKNSVAAAVIDGKGIDDQGELVLTLESLNKFIKNNYV
jgi:SNF2 family DNA or RNA helicase